MGNGVGLIFPHFFISGHFTLRFKFTILLVLDGWICGMGKYQPSRELVLSALGDHRPRSNREIVEATGLSQSSVYNALALCWKRGLVLRTAQPLYEHERIFKGRGGLTQTTRPYHLYLLKPEGVDSTAIEGHRFVGYDPKYLMPEAAGRLARRRESSGLFRPTGTEPSFPLRSRKP